MTLDLTPAGSRPWRESLAAVHPSWLIPSALFLARDDLHSPELTWKWKCPWKTIFLYKQGVFHFHVSCREGMHSPGLRSLHHEVRARGRQDFRGLLEVPEFRLASPRESPRRVKQRRVKSTPTQLFNCRCHEGKGQSDRTSDPRFQTAKICGTWMSMADLIHGLMWYIINNTQNYSK